jgi:hypothetical protein
LNETVPLPELFGGVTPVIQGTRGPAVQVQELISVDGEFGVAITLATPEPPAGPKDVVLELTV